MFEMDDIGTLKYCLGWGKPKAAATLDLLRVYDMETAIRLVHKPHIENPWLRQMILNVIICETNCN